MRTKQCVNCLFCDTLVVSEGEMYVCKKSDTETTSDDFCHGHIWWDDKSVGLNGGL
jgi:hypothetical protein